MWKAALIIGWFSFTFSMMACQSSANKEKEVVETNTIVSAKDKKQKEIDKPSESSESKIENQQDSKAKPLAPAAQRKPIDYGTVRIIGYQKIVPYDDASNMVKVMEGLWTKLYNEDFSHTLKSAVDNNMVYSVYSDYNKPKGMMAVTIGYAVSDYNTVPKGTVKMTIPKNLYYKWELSGKTSDYEGKEWQQLNGLIPYRKKNSLDFEVFTLNENYDVTSAFIYIASK